jgi:hypothetical protein
MYNKKYKNIMKIPKYLITTNKVKRNIPNKEIELNVIKTFQV